MDFSIIIPTCNRKNVLRHVILSLINQGIDNYEVIICDDGSDDGTKEMIQQIKVPFELRYQFQEKQGFRAGQARNMGIKAARGEKLIFIDHDVIISPMALKHLNEICKENLYVSGCKKLVPIDFYNNKINDDVVLNNFLIFDTQLHGEIPATLSSFGMIYKKHIDSIGGFDERFVGWGLEDSDLVARLSTSGITIKTYGYHIEHQPNIFGDWNKQLYHQKRKIDNWNILHGKKQ